MGKSHSGNGWTVELDDAFTGDVFDVWENSAQRAGEAGAERWAVVGDGIKAISLGGKVDTGGLETLTTWTKPSVF